MAKKTLRIGTTTTRISPGSMSCNACKEPATNSIFSSVKAAQVTLYSCDNPACIDKVEADTVGAILRYASRFPYVGGGRLAEQVVDLIQ